MPNKSAGTDRHTGAMLVYGPRLRGRWLIFTLPPAELGIHPVDHPGAKAGDHAISLMCDDIHATVRDLRARGIQISGEPEDHGYGITVMAALPGDVRIQVYEPRHPLAITPAS